VSWREVVATVLIVLGGAVELLAVLGLCLMKDTYDRLHYAGLVSVGALLIGLAVLFREGFSQIGDGALLTGVILVLTGPVLVQTTMRSFLIRQHGDWRAPIDQAREEQQP
jgi:monovalent cation/proton antiporter MnhG/PhaG subunit